MTEQTLAATVESPQELARGFSRYQSGLVALLASSSSPSFSISSSCRRSAPS
jgi:hypothetical protein